MVLKKVGQLVQSEKIRVAGVNYKVVDLEKGTFGSNTDAYVQKQIVSHSEIYGPTIMLSDEIGVAWRGTEQLVEVTHSVAAAPSLADSLRAQVQEQKSEKASLADSFRAQINGASQEKAVVASNEPIVASSSIGASKILFNGSIGHSNESLSKDVLTASFRAQPALNTAEEAKEASQAARSDASELQEGYEHIENRVEREEHKREEVSRELEELTERVEELENKQSEEEERVNLQQQLNASLNRKKENSDLQARLDEKLKQKTGGSSKMKNLLGAFTGQFGKVEGKFAISPTGGLALRRGVSNDYVAYNAEAGTITDVQNLVLDVKVPAFRLPVEASQVKVGNIVVNEGKYGYVTDAADDYVTVVYPESNSRGSVLPVTNLLLGKPFYTVIQTLDIAGQAGFNPALLLAMGDGKKDDLLPFLLMSGGLGGQAAGGLDPMMLMLLKDSADDLLPFLLMQQGGVAKEGFNPLMLLALGDKGSNKKDSLLPLLMMSQQGGAAQGGFNPMMLALLGDGDVDLTTLALMGGLGGNGANPFGGLFGGQAANAGTPSTRTVSQGATGTDGKPEQK